jgi:hypothetical protein
MTKITFNEHIFESLSGKSRWKNISQWFDEKVLTVQGPRKK